MKHIVLLAAFLLLPIPCAYADEANEAGGQVSDFHSPFLAAFEQSLDNNASAPVFTEKIESVLSGLQLAQMSKLATPRFMAPVVDQTTVTFSWNEVDARTSVTYSINIYRGTETTEPNRVLGPSTVTETYFRVADDQLEPEETYTITVVASAAGHDDSEVGRSSVETELIQLPKPSEGDFRTTATTNSITVTWNDVVPASVRVYFTGDRATRNGQFGYIFGLNDDPGHPTRFIPGEAMHTFENLDPDTEHEVRIASTFGKGLLSSNNLEVNFSDIGFNSQNTLMLAVRTAALPTLPRPTTTFAITLGDTTTAQLTWETPEMSDAITYQISLDGEIQAEVAVTSESYILTGIAREAQHCLRIVARAGPNFLDSPPRPFTLKNGMLSEGCGPRIRLRVFLEGPLQ